MNDDPSLHNRPCPRGRRRPTSGLAGLAAALGALLVACGGEPTDPGGGPPPPEDGHPFEYVPPTGAPAIASIAVRGSFNAWEQTTMTRRDDGVWRAYVDLADGTHRYKFYINGAWIDDMCFDETWGHPDQQYVVDPAADACTSDGFEGQNAVITLGAVPLSFHHDPGDPSFASIAGGRLSLRFRVRTDEVRAATVTADGEEFSAHRQLTVGLYDYWRAPVPQDAARYTFRVETGDSTATFGPYDAPPDPFRSVAWAERAVAYQIFPERFRNGDPSNDSLALETDEIHFLDPALEGTEPTLTAWDGPVGASHCCHQYFGGDLQGVIDGLDHLEGLGVTALYLNPIFLAGSAHGYDTYDYRSVAPNFGDSLTLRSLVDEADARGIRLIWDFVPNHVGIGHWAFQDALAGGPDSDHWSWFEFFVPADQVQAGNGEHYAAWWGFGSLPELQTEVPAVFEHLLEVTERWTAFGLDGIRVDVPGDIDNRAAFFPAWRAAARAVDPDVYLLGEVWERDSTWLQGDEFDALMNYALGHGMVAPFARGEISGVVAAREMAALYAAYPEAAAAMLFNLVASHDTDRLLTMLGGGELGQTPGAEALARQRLASALLYALPGMPVTFQGDECAQLGGAGGAHTARYPVQWDRCDAEMVTHYQALGELRHELGALASPAVRAHEASRTLLSFLRGEPGPGEVLAVFNNGQAAASLELPAGSWTDPASGDAVGGSVSVAGPGWTYLVRQ